MGVDMGVPPVNMVRNGVMDDGEALLGWITFG